jgi:hypothetical protein
MPNAVVSLQLQSQVAPQIAATANAYKTLSAEEQKAERAATAYAASLSKVALADAKTATEEQRLAIQTANAAKAQTQAEAAALRLAQAQEKAASGNSYAAETAQAFGSQIGAMVSPVALAAGAIAGLVTVANSFKEAFQFKAQLDQTTASIQVQLAGVRDSATVFAGAARFANEYKLTQQETTEAIRSSLPVIRSSNASTEQILGTLARLRVLNPEQDFAGAARALAELKAGQINSIVDRFNIARSSANAMKQEIQQGGDAVLILSKYLDSAGVGMDSLKAGATGASGALRELARAEEELKIAQGEFAQGPGLLILQARINVTRDAVKVFQGDVRGLNDVLRDSGVGAINPIIGALTTYNSYVLDAGKNALTWAGILQNSANPATANNAGASDAAAQAAQYYAGRVAVAGNQADIASDKVDKLSAAELRQANASGLAAQRQGERQGGGASGTAEDAAAEDAKAQQTFARLGQAAKDKASADAQKLQDARDALALSRARTAGQRIAELKRQQAATADPVEKLQLQAQIEQAQQSTAKAHTSELSKQLNLHESIYDSLNKQRDAALDIEELTIRDRQQDRADAEKLKTAQRILASPNASADLKARAQDAIDLISVEDRKRAQAIAEKSATAGGQIINGKVFQSSAGAPLPPTGAAGPLGALPPGPAGPGGAGGPNAPLTINLVVDGKTLASVSEPYIMDSLLKAVRGARASQGA